SPARAGVEADAPGLCRQRERVSRREDVDALVRPLGTRRAVVVAELDRAQDGEDDLARRLRLRDRRADGPRIDRGGSSRPRGAAGSDLVATSRALAATLEKEGADLVLFGQQSSDSDGAVLWAAVADRLRRPVISQVAELTVADGTVRGKRQTEFGYDVIEAPM